MPALRVEVHPDAEGELRRLPEHERQAVQNAFEKLEALGDQLPFPHTSKVRGGRELRELRPRAGRSPWRAFYARVGDRLAIGSIGPEARMDPQGFRRAARAAEERIAGVEQR